MPPAPQVPVPERDWDRTVGIILTGPTCTRPAAVSRRTVLKAATGLTAAALAPAVSGRSFGADAAPFTACVIGDTGRGDYGHGMDVVFGGLPGIRVIAVADPDPAGREKAAARCGAERQYADYREMLEKERPNLVSVAPRWSEKHRDMALAAIAAGAHVILEKPITPTLAEADEVLAAADKARRKVAVVHQMRLAPAVVHLKRRVDDGLIGDLLQINAWGKQDARAGGEDLLVLGVHLFDLMRLFAGDPLWCSARVLQNGRDVTRADARSVTERIGPVAGDEVSANFAFGRGVTATFTSRGRLRERTGHWGLELVGSRTAVRILADIWPTVYVMEPGKWGLAGRTDVWKRLEDDPSVKATAAEQATGPANRRVAEDWLAAVREDREPACSGRNAMKALEMVMAVYHAALGGGRARLPLAERGHPLVGP